jgi:hypothetical protein
VCPAIFGRPFLHTIGVEINLPKEKVVISCAGENQKLNLFSSLLRSIGKRNGGERLLEEKCPSTMVENYGKRVVFRG